jgi:O-antigen/teichoic acid export membrane protein
MAGNAVWRLAATIVRVGVGLVAVSALTRLLGIGQWGLLALFQAAVAPLALLDGLGRATVKYASESLGRGDSEGAARVVRTAAVLNAVLGAAGTAALLLCAPWLASSLFAIPPEEAARATVGFRIMGGAWFVGVMTTPFSAVLAAHQRYDVAAKLGTVAVVLSTGLGVAAAALTRDVVLVIVAQTTGAAAMLALYVWAASRLLPGVAAAPRLDRPTLRRTVAFWRGEVVGVAGGLLTGWADRYILGAFFGPAIVGFYALANLLSTQLYAAFLEMGEVLFPAVSHLEGRGELPAARRLALLVGWTLTMGFGASAAVLGTVGGDFLHLWVSPDAARAATPTLRVLCVAAILALTSVAPLFYVLGIGKTRWDAAGSVVLGLTVVGVGLVLIPAHGLLGVGYGLVAGALVRCGLALLIWRVHFRPQFGLGAFAVHAWAPAVVSILAMLGLGRVHDALGRAPTWPWLVAESFATLAIAVAVQVAAAEVLPGGRQRRLDVVNSFRPIVARWRGAGSDARR